MLVQAGDPTVGGVTFPASGSPIAACPVSGQPVGWALETGLLPLANGHLMPFTVTVCVLGVTPPSVSQPPTTPINGAEMLPFPAVPKMSNASGFTPTCTPLHELMNILFVTLSWPLESTISVCTSHPVSRATKL